MTRWLFTLITAAALAAPAARAEMIEANPDQIAAAFTAYGLPVERGLDDAGDPRIDSRVEGVHFQVLFYNCELLECRSIQFVAGFDMEDGMAMSRVNGWNRGKRWGKVYLDDENDPFVEMDVNLDFGGVTSEGFDDSIDIWRLVIDEFKDYIDW